MVNAGGAVGDITLNPNTMVPPCATTTVTLDGNLPSDAADGTALDRVVKVYDAAGTERNLTLTFTKTGNGWDVAGTDDNGATDRRHPDASPNGKLTGRRPLDRQRHHRGPLQGLRLRRA